MLAGLNVVLTLTLVSACGPSGRVPSGLRGPLAGLLASMARPVDCRPVDLQFDPPWRRGPYTECLLRFGRDSTVSFTLDGDSVVANLAVRVLSISGADSAATVARHRAVFVSRLGAGTVCGPALTNWVRDSVEAALWVRPEQDSRVPGARLTYAVTRMARLGRLPDAFRCPGARRAADIRSADFHDEA
jgi:hypothetical protein